MASCNCNVRELEEQEIERQKERVNGTAVEVDDRDGTPFSGGGA